MDRGNNVVELRNVAIYHGDDTSRRGAGAEGELVLSDVNLSVAAGETVYFIGRVGSGKSTLVNLIPRFFDVTEGKITLDGVSGTVAENIAYGRPDATREEIIAAAKAAKVDYFIRTMPHGYDTMLDNEAANLSAGQRQLITIARVFLCNPPVIILDEATSSVDTRTEAEIGKAMKKLMKGRTSFVIAHRLSTIRDADTILFMERGNIIEQGNHRELLAKKGAYASLYYSQFE